MPQHFVGVFLGDSMNVVFDEMIDGFRFTGLAEKEIGEEATEISPSWPTFYTVFTIHVDGSHKDFMDIINPAIIQRIETMLAEDA
jgi:hypothetical protein